MQEAENRIPLRSKRDVTIKVTNVEEDGSVSLSQEQLQRSVSATATLSDPDKGENRVRWQWQRVAARPGNGETCPAASDGDWTTDD